MNRCLKVILTDLLKCCCSSAAYIYLGIWCTWHTESAAASIRCMFVRYYHLLPFDYIGDNGGTRLFRFFPKMFANTNWMCTETLNGTVTCCLLLFYYCFIVILCWSDGLYGFFIAFLFLSFSFPIDDTYFVWLPPFSCCCFFFKWLFIIYNKTIFYFANRSEIAVRICTKRHHATNALMCVRVFFCCCVVQRAFLN